MTDNTISYDLDFIENFITNLRAVIAGFAEPSETLAAVQTTFTQEASTGTTSGALPPLFEPLGKEVGLAVTKAQGNLAELVKALENDAEFLEELVAKVRDHEDASARDIAGVDQPSEVV